MKNELKLGSILATLSILLGSLVQIIYTPMYMKYLGTSDYGINSLVQSIMGYIGILNLCLGNTMVKYIIKYKIDGTKEEESKINGMFLIIFSFFALICMLLGIYLYLLLPEFFEGKFTNNEIIKTKKVFIYMLINTIISFPINIFSSNIIAMQKFIYKKVLFLLKIIVTPVLSWLLMLKGFGLLEIVILNVILNISIYIFDIYYAFRLGMRIKFQNLDIKILKEVFNYSFYIFLNNIFDKIFWGTDRILVGKYLGTTMVSIYSIASIFNDVYMNLSSSISGVLFPKINILVVEKNFSELSNLFIKIGRIQYLLLGLISTGFVVFGKEFIYLWLGDGYKETYYLTLLTLLPLTIPLIQNTGIAIMQARNLHKFRSKLYFLLSLFNIFLSILLLGNQKIFGCAIATSISIIIGPVILMNIYYQKRIDINIVLFWKNILNMTIPMIVVFIFGILMNKIILYYSFKNFIFKGSVYTLFYLILMYFMGMNTEEKNEVKKLLKKLWLLK